MQLFGRRWGLILLLHSFQQSLLSAFTDVLEHKMKIILTEYILCYVHLDLF